MRRQRFGYSKPRRLGAAAGCGGSGSAAAVRQPQHGVQNPYGRPEQVIKACRSPLLIKRMNQTHHRGSPRAQNRGFCALLPSETLIFRPFEHKIEVFVRFWPQKPSFSGLPSTKIGFLCSGRRGMALESVTAETLTVNVAFLQITEHAYKTQAPHNQIINY